MSDDDSKVEVQRPSSDRGKATGRFSKLKAMECFGEVRKQLAGGVSTSKVAKRIQEKHGEYMDVKRASLERVLRRFRDEEIPSTEKVRRQDPERFEEEVEEFEEEVDVLDEYQKLYSIQKGRVERNLEQEEDMGVLMEQTGREIDRAAELLARLAKYRQEFGVEDRQLGTLKVEAGMQSEIHESTGLDPSAVGDASKRNQLVEFIRQLDKTDPRAVEAAIGDGEVVDVDRADEEEGDGD